MTYTVTYKPSAENELAELWLNAPDRQTVADAANRIDSLLGANPHNQGESREQQTRILFERPLAVQFEIHDANRVVEVLKIWWIGS
jgi:mRNA-degrading endonuclease RelE of RelBE toxin-antitoxin system